MAHAAMKHFSTLLLVLNFCMYLVALGICAWAVNIAIDYYAFDVIIEPGSDFPPHLSPLYFPMGNAATGLFVVFALIAGAVGAGSAFAGFNHIRHWNADSLQPAASVAAIAWILTLLAMGFGCKEIELRTMRNGCLKTLESFMIILGATQLMYMGAIHGASSIRGPSLLEG
ncbi:membrane protein PM19L [Ricinus communis]|uniref:AWPM-19-like family protein n=1 Tax=Ricinus communis TaxID=3988 RepID=B9RB70_RICCO|nr:membrane protein PM19L [Ricinus communis]EEF52047.1 conserved hypothetical protein [Ricinus communis]|eukprot:XP_002511445.1 membrane protein PM19L [Ricinus communis]